MCQDKGRLTSLDCSCSRLSAVSPQPCLSGLVRSYRRLSVRSADSATETEMQLGDMFKSPRFITAAMEDTTNDI